MVEGKSRGRSSETPSNAIYETRFADQGEIYFCIASILKYAPFIRYIHVVTDEQSPAFLSAFSAEGICAPDRIRVVEHSEIFRGYEEALPSFNSLSIETMMWRIKGIAERFLYFNDDFFLNAPVSIDDFFTTDGKLRVFGRSRSTKPLRIKSVMRRWRYSLLRTGNIPAHYKTAQAISAELAGCKKYVQLGHHPHALIRETFARYFAGHDALLRHQIAPSFRDIQQFLPVGLCNHLEIAAGNATIEAERVPVYMKPNNFSQAHLDEVTEGKEKFGCVQSLDEFSEEDQTRLRRTLAAKFEGFVPKAVLHAQGLSPG